MAIYNNSDLTVVFRDLPLKYSPLSTQPPQSQQNKVLQSPINEEPSQYDGKRRYGLFNVGKSYNISYAVFIDSQADIDEIISDSEDEIDLLYDPSLNCYYDPKTGTYYELNLS